MYQICTAFEDKLMTPKKVLKNFNPIIFYYIFDLTILCHVQAEPDWSKIRLYRNNVVVGLGLYLLFLFSLGKLIGGFCALCGTFILTLPIPIVVNSFAGYYKNRLWRNEVAQKKRERAMAQASEAREMQKMNLFQAMAAPTAGMTSNFQSSVKYQQQE